MRRKNNWPSSGEPEATPAEIVDTIELHEQIMLLPKVDLKDPEQLRERIALYIGMCKRSGHRPFVEGLAAALKTSRQELWKIAKERSERGDVIRDAKRMIISMLESWHVEGRINPASAIFLMANLSDYRDVKTIVALPAEDSIPAANLSKEEIVQMIENDIPIDETPEPARIETGII